MFCDSEWVYVVLHPLFPILNGEDSLLRRGVLLRYIYMTLKTVSRPCQIQVGIAQPWFCGHIRIAWIRQTLQRFRHTWIQKSLSLQNNPSQRCQQPAMLGICYHQHWRCDPTAAFPRPKATAGPKIYWSQLLLTRMCPLSLLYLEEDGMHSSGWYGQKGDPFSGWVMVQAGMQRLWDQESKHQRAQAASTGLLREAGLGLFYLITSSPWKIEARD